MLNPDKKISPHSLNTVLSFIRAEGHSFVLSCYDEIAILEMDDPYVTIFFDGPYMHVEHQPRVGDKFTSYKTDNEIDIKTILIGLDEW